MIIKKYWSQLILIVIIAISFLRGCENPFAKQNTDDVVKTDTIFRTVVIQEKKGNFKTNNPIPYNTRPIILNGQNNTDLQNYLLKLTETIKTQSIKDRELTKQLIQALAKKEYKETKEDSIVKITVNSTVEDGKQTYLGIDYKVKKSYLKTYDTKTTIKKYPKYTISAGLGISSSLSIQAQPQIQAILGLKNKKGTEIQLGFSTDKKATIIYKKDIFTKY